MRCQPAPAPPESRSKNLSKLGKLALLLVLSLLSLSAPAAVVTNCDQASFSSAMVRAYLESISFGHGSIEFDCSGTITLTNGFNILADTDITIDAGDHAVTLDAGTTITTNTAGIVTTSGPRFFRVTEHATLRLRNLTLTNGFGTNGGAIYVHEQGTLLAEACVFSGNRAKGTNGVPGATGSNGQNFGQDGGGGGDARPAFGGAIYNLGTGTLSGCTFLINSATGGSGGPGGNAGNGEFRGGDGGDGGGGAQGIGGAICNFGGLVLTNCTFSGNTATGGNGAAGGTGGTGIFASQHGAGGAGAAGAGAALYNGGTMTVMNCAVFDNVARGGNSVGDGSRDNGRGVPGPPGADSLGGGLCNAGTARLVNCTFSGNQITAGNGGNGGPGDFIGGDGGNGGNGYGGSLYNGSSAYVTNCTFSGGSATGGTNGVAGSAPFPGVDGTPGAGAGGNLAALAGTLLLKNCIIANAASGGNGFGSITDGGSNLSSDTSLAFSASGSLNSTDALLSPLAYNGGLTPTMALSAESPAIDRGDGDACRPADQRNTPRVNTCDIGSYEYGSRPIILTQPSSQTKALGGSATFSVRVTGEPPFTYQWRFNRQSISGATNASYTVSSVQTSHLGNYDVVISGQFGFATSTRALLATSSPSIVTQPQSQTVPAGDNSTFTAVASGTGPLSYQWRFNETAISGANSASYTVVSAQPAQAGNYQLVVTNLFGSSTSAVATLTVKFPPSITQQPASLTLNQGQAATFSVTAKGVPTPSYQWRFNATTQDGETNASLTIPAVQPTDAGAYSVVVSNSEGTTNSANATLTVRVPPTITTQPRNLTVTEGESASFSVVAVGEAPLAYHWQFNGSNLPGATSPNFTIAAVQANQAGLYRAVVTNGFGAVTSAVANLTILLPLQISQQPISQVVTQGSRVTFSVEVATSANAVSYQWLLNDGLLLGATSRILTINKVKTSQAGNYRVIVSDNLGGYEESDSAGLRVFVAPLLINPRLDSTNFKFDYQSESNVFYVLEYSNSFASTNSWSALATNLGTGQLTTQVISTNGRPRGLFRLRLQ